MLFSVIIATHNRAGLLMEALASVMRQTFSDFEIVVGNDASTDDTVDRIRAAYPAVKAVSLPVNSGPGAARNIAILAASGDYVALLDDDDLWPPWTLAAYAGAISRHNRPAYVSANGISFQDPAELSALAPGDLESRGFRDYLTYATGPHQVGWLTTCGAAVRRDAALASGLFDPALTYHEDEDFWLRLGNAPGFVRIAAPLCWGYRSHPSMSSILDRRFPNLHRMIAQERCGVYPGGNGRAQERRAVISQRGRHLARRAAAEGRPVEAGRLYLALLPWSLRLFRIRFLMLFPVEIAAFVVRRRLALRV